MPQVDVVQLREGVAAGVVDAAVAWVPRQVEQQDEPEQVRIGDRLGQRQHDPFVLRPPFVGFDPGQIPQRDLLDRFR